MEEEQTPIDPESGANGPDVDPESGANGPDVEHQDVEHQDDDAEHQDDDAEHQDETFGRPYVDKLRRESRKYRERATEATERAGRLERDLFTERVRSIGRLADPTDLPFDADALDDADALAAAVDELLTRKPHLRTRRVQAGSIGQGQGSADAGPSLASMLRANA